MLARLVLGFLLAGFTAVASAQSQPVAGRDYTVLNPPQPSEGGGKIEVVEFFWYGCPHCYGLEPFVEKWTKNLPKDVVFRRVPAMFNDNWAMAGQIYYTFEAMNLVDKLHRPFFDAVHKDNLRYTNDGQVADFLKKHGVDPAEFEKTKRSFSVQSRVRRAIQMTESYKFDGVPAMAVNGKYLATATQAKTPERLIENTDGLIALVRKEGGAAAPAAAAPAPAKK
jgi:thiol:disulfide interchange protein DsbA